MGCRKNLKTREKNLKLAGNLDLYTFVTAKVPEICAHVSSESWTSKNIQYLNLVDKIRMVIVKLLCAKFSNGYQLDKCLFGVDKGILDLKHRFFAIRQYFWAIPKSIILPKTFAHENRMFPAQDLEFRYNFIFFSRVFGFFRHPQPRAEIRKNRVG